MDGSFASRYSHNPNVPTYQSTPMTRKAQTYQYVNGHQRSPSVEFKTPTSSVHTSGGEDVIFEKGNLSGSKRSSQDNKSTSPASKLAEMDANTILRQRKELQVMISELKDRDKELNNLVQSHHKQLVSWEVDRERMSTVEKQLSKVKAEYRKRHEQCKILKEKLRKQGTELQAKTRELESVQAQFLQLSNRESLATNQIEEISLKNNTLQCSVEELSNNLGALRAHEQQLETLLRLRDNDLKDANLRVEELTEKLKTSNTSLNEHKKLDSDAKSELLKARAENVLLKEEMDKLKASYYESLEMEGQEEISHLKQEIIVLQKDLLLTGEQEKRKDSLLELARTKQERTDIELSNMRLLYDKMQGEQLASRQQQQQQHWGNQDDDKISVFSMSEFGEKEKDSSAIMNSTILLESPISSFLVSNEGEEMKNKFSPISACPSTTNRSLQSVRNEDGGTMTTGELRHTDDLSSNFEENNQSDEINFNVINSISNGVNAMDLKGVTRLNNFNAVTNGVKFNDEVSPASRLEKLLTQSQQMVEDLENSASFLAMNIIDEDNEDPSPDGNKEQINGGYL